MDFLKGRTNRANYWAALGVVATLLIGLSLITHETVPVQEFVLVFICVPRLHDIGRSGWWVAAPIAFEVIATIAALTLLSEEMAGVVLGGMTLVLAGLLTWLGAVPGERQANRFGEPPIRGVQWGRRKGGKA